MSKNAPEKCVFPWNMYSTSDLVLYITAYINFLSAVVKVHASVPYDCAGLAYFFN
jgi:hypothetical protein